MRLPVDQSLSVPFIPGSAGAPVTCAALDRARPALAGSARARPALDQSNTRWLPSPMRHSGIAVHLPSESPPWREIPFWPPRRKTAQLTPLSHVFQQNWVRFFHFRHTPSGGIAKAVKLSHARFNFIFSIRSITYSRTPPNSAIRPAKLKSGRACAPLTSPTVFSGKEHCS
jgi:hypothetical protein